MVKDALRYAKFKGVMPEIKEHDVKRIFYYMIPREMKPSFVINVSSVKDKLVEVIKCHESQMSIKRGKKNVLDMLNVYREMTGLFAGSSFSEAFLCEEILKAEVRDFFKF
jgi:hypothetical protein